MSLNQSKLNILEDLERQLSDALTTVLILKSKLFGVHEKNYESTLCNLCQDDLCKTLLRANQGRGKRENLTGLYIDTLQPMQKISYSDIFDQYESCKEIFTPLQWEVIYLYYSQGLTQEQVGTQLGKTRKAVSGLLQRAKARKAEHDRKIRAEKYEVMKKSIKEDED